MEYNINLHYDNLVAELFDWYQCQPFMVVNKIHDVDLFAEPESSIEYTLDELREAWNDMGIEVQLEHYNQYKDFKY